MNWSKFKREFEEAGEDIHLYPFIVSWKENTDVFNSLRGEIRGEDQELAHDVILNVTQVSIPGLPELFDVRWKTIDAFLENIHPNAPVFEGRAVVSSPFLAAAAIHFGEVSQCLTK